MSRPCRPVAPRLVRPPRTPLRRSGSDPTPRIYPQYKARSRSSAPSRFRGGFCTQLQAVPPRLFLSPAFFTRTAQGKAPEKLFDKVRIGTRVIISSSDAEPVEFSHPALFVPKSEAIAAAPTRSETLAREADEATKLAQQTKNSAALAVKEAAPLMAALRRLELAKTGADAALAVAEKALAAAKTDQAKPRAEDQKQKAAAKVEELQTQIDAAKANAKSKLDAAAAAQDAAKASETKKADAAKAATQPKLALEPVSVFI